MGSEMCIRDRYIAAPGTYCDSRMAYLGADMIIISCCLHITPYLVRVVADGDCCTDEGTRRRNCCKHTGIRKEKMRKKMQKARHEKKQENCPQESWDISATRTRTTPPKKVLVCCAFELRTWDFVVVVVRVYFFGVDDFLYLMLFTLFE